MKLELKNKLSYILHMKEIEKSNNDNGNTAPEKVGFFKSLLAAFFKNTSPEAEKRRKLKSIAKAISKSKFRNFYKPGSAEMLSGFGKFIFDIYRVIAPIQQILKNDQKLLFFKRKIINYTLSERQLDLIEKLDERRIIELSKKTDIEKLKHGVEQVLQSFINEFDGDRASKAANLSKAFILFKDFCTFDYYLILKKYDSSYQEYSLETSPRIDKVNAEYIMDDLKDFLTVAYAITDESIDWEDLFDMFKQSVGKELISVSVWKKIISRLRLIQTSNILDLIVRHVTHDLKYETKINTQIPSLIEPYIDKIESDTRSLLEKIQYAQKENRASSICMQIFGTATPKSMKHYVSTLNSSLEKKELTQLEFAEPLNYLKTFLIEFVKKNIREYYEVVVIRGQWDSSMSAPMSNAYQELLKTSDKITAFDEDFSDDGQTGSKLKTLLPKTTHDAGAENIINRIITDANDNAKGFIIQSTQNLITIGKIIKRLIEDYAAPKSTIVHNWKELERYIETPMKEFCVDIYKKIYLFVQLMQTYIKH